MVKRCAVCEREFETIRAATKTCSSRCRQRAHRAPKVPADPKVLAVFSAVAPGDLTEATRSGLVAAGRLDSELGTAVMYLAARLDNVGLMETGASVAALMREYRATLAEAMKDADAANDPLEALRESAALKLIQGGAA